MDEILKIIAKNPEMVMPLVKEYIEKYKPIVYELAQEVVKIYNDYSNNTEFPTIVARTKKNMYDAYISVGFSDDQALALMINDNIQLMKNIKEASSNRSKTETPTI